LVISVVVSLVVLFDEKNPSWLEIILVLISINLLLIYPFVVDECSTQYADVYIYDGNNNIIEAYKHIDEDYIEYIDDNNIAIYNKSLDKELYYSKDRVKIIQEE
jgi:hypothetical protein